MISTILENEFYKNMYHTGILVAILSILSCVSYLILTHIFKASRNRKKIKIRVLYVTIILMVIFCAKIWVQGFTHIFYGISLVSAGLVVTNKESIMNIVGWGIISWRELFSEGDYIEVAGHFGIVYDLGLFYFKLLEANATIYNRSTGKFIKIPNGLVINSAVKRFSIEKHHIEQQINCLISVSKDIVKVKRQILAIVDEVVNATAHARAPSFKSKYEMDLVNTYIYQPCHIYSAFYPDKPEYIKLTITYHCKVKDQYYIRETILEKLLEQTTIFKSPAHIDSDACQTSLA